MEPSSDACDERRIADAIALAHRFVEEAAASDARSGVGARLRRRRLRTLVAEPAAADFTVRLTDEVTRISAPDRAAARFSRLVADADTSAFPIIDRLLLRAGARLAPIVPGLVMPLVQRRLRAEADGVILPAEDPGLADHLHARAEHGIRCNVNVLGEAIVGDGEASRRLDMVLARLRRPDVDYVSVKISAVCANISVLAFDDTVERVTDRLRPLFEVAASFDPPKFVNLDMEEYGDLELTIAVFRNLLDRTEFEHLDGGIVLQAYLPDVQTSARELATWALHRWARAGGRTKIRVVKGANLAMEAVEAELEGWTPAPYPSKADVDANYKAVLDVLTSPEFDDAVRVGVASHNLFDVAWAFGLRSEMMAAGRQSRLEFEMLEGMAPSQADAVRATTGDLLMYSPVVTDDDFPAAIAYLVRRLDENTSPDNFLSHLFDLADDPALFERESERFAAAARARHAVASEPRRTQDRSIAPQPIPLDRAFVNAPDTDWTRAKNRAWIADITSCAKDSSEHVASLRTISPDSPGSTDLSTRPHSGQVVDRPSSSNPAQFEDVARSGQVVDRPSSPNPAQFEDVARSGQVVDRLSSPIPAQFEDVDRSGPGLRSSHGSRSVVGVDDVDRAVTTAVAAQLAWARRFDRAALVNAVGDQFEVNRRRVLATMAAEAGKTIAQGDPEVSEAVDFARYYARSGGHLADIDGATAGPRGTVVVVPPWNFPFAIPAGGVLAALVAGNTVILKPAPQTVETAALIAELCWEAGVPRDVLQFVPAGDDEAGRRLVTHPDVDAVILTGSHETAAMFHSWRPDLRLHAETSGKNALVITATADRDHAVADLVASAFGHAGQKCSAASLAIVEAPLYDDAAFLERIRDAAATLTVGAPDDLASDIGPLVDPPGDDLERALTTLEPGESWLLRPDCRSDDRRLWSPGIRIGVQSGSWFAGRECFGPVLGIVRADDLDHAIEIQNSTDFGLTAGLHALDPAEIETWVDRAEAGNLYVNRGITGAIVQRQPFGGWKRSVVGPTAKAGGPNYVATLCRWVDDASVPTADIGARFGRWWVEVGSQEHDPTGLAAERNGFRYRPLPGGVAVRFETGATDRERELVRMAAASTGCRLVISDAADETPEDFAGRVHPLGVDRVRLIRDANPTTITTDTDHLIAVACHLADLAFDDSPLVGAPEVELPRWLREQAVTVTTHRHGRIATSHTAKASATAG